jgi:hypothetical protein
VETKIPRQLGCIAGAQELWMFLSALQIQVTGAREAAYSADNRIELPCKNDSGGWTEKQI